MDHLSVGLSRGRGTESEADHLHAHTRRGTVWCGVVWLAWSWIFRLTWPGSFCSEMTLKLTRGALRSGVGGYGEGRGGRDKVTCEGELCAHFSWLCLPVVEEE